MRARTALMLLLAGACTTVPERQELIEFINTAIRSGDSVRISLSELADFTWNEVCIANPDAQGPVLSEHLGFRWRGRGVRCPSPD